MGIWISLVVIAVCFLFIVLGQSYSPILAENTDVKMLNMSLVRTAEFFVIIGEIAPYIGIGFCLVVVILSRKPKSKTGSGEVVSMDLDW